MLEKSLLALEATASRCSADAASYLHVRTTMAAGKVRLHSPFQTIDFSELFTCTHQRRRRRSG